MIYLYGPPGSGKSAAGKILAQRLNLPFFDLDEEIEKQTGATIPEIFAQQGEQTFREIEHTEIQRLQSLKKAVVALGGGALTSPAGRDLAESHGTVVCLNASPDVLLLRLQNDPVQRPLLAADAKTKLADLLARREEHYRSFAIRLDTTQLDPSQVAWQVQVLLGRFRLGQQGQPYEVCVQAGGLGSIGEYIFEQKFHGPFAVVADSNTARLYAGRVKASLESVGAEGQWIIIPAGESSKTIQTAQMLWEGFLDAGLERSSTAIALGGGVVGDLTGFAASTYMRGIRWVNIPTSLLAMVDASLGGKTGVDIPRGKNLVGAFHTPAFVLADPQVLETLPEAEFRSGMAEVIKHGVIGDAGLLEMVKNPGDVAELVSRAMAVKIAIIEIDPYENGMRAALNFGHTVGHALELVSGYRLRHGEAVAIGMVVETRLAERLGLAEEGFSARIAAALQKFDLPTDIPADIDRLAIRRAIGVDKKKSAGRVRFALPACIGQVQTGVDVPDDMLAVEL